MLFFFRRCVMDLQFESVQLGLESRPRTGSLCVQVTLGAVSLHDYLTVNSAFPVLISPQSMFYFHSNFYIFLLLETGNSSCFLISGANAKGRTLVPRFKISLFVTQPFKL